MLLPEFDRPVRSGDDPLIPDPSGALRGLVAILLVFLTVKVVFLVVLAVNTAFVMDEYTHFADTRLSLAHVYQTTWPPKTLLYAAFFGIAHWFADGAVQLMLVARVQSAAVAMAGLGLLYLIARQLGRSRLQAIFVIAVVLAFSSYIEWAFMVRPEPLGLLFALMALWVVMRDEGTLGVYVVAGLLSGLAFLTMQKAVYFNLALGLALVGDGLARRSLKEAVLSGAFLVLGWAIVVGAYGLFFSLQGASFTEVLSYVLTGPSAENVVRGYEVYGSLRHFVIRVLLRDPALYALCVGGLAFVAFRFSRLSGPERRAWIFSAVIGILVFTHRSPWPYNFIMAIPFLALWSTVLPPLFLKRVMPVKVAFAGLMAFVFAVSLARNVMYLQHDNGFQNRTLRLAESLVGPDDAYADGIRMLVTRRGVVPSWWDRRTIARLRARAEQGDLGEFATTFEGKPKVWILSYRTAALNDFLQPYLVASYVPVFPNILLTGIELRPGKDVRFENRWPGKYRLYKADGSPVETPLVIDRSRVAGPVELETGPHSLRLVEGQEPLFLLPADIAVPFDLTRPRERKTLFDRVYTF